MQIARNSSLQAAASGSSSMPRKGRARSPDPPGQIATGVLIAEKDTEIGALKEQVAEIGKNLRLMEKHVKEERTAKDKVTVEVLRRNNEGWEQKLAAKDQVLADKDGEIARLGRVLQEVRETAREDLAKSCNEKDSEIERRRLVDEEQTWELQQTGDRLAATDKKNERLRKEARPGVEVHYVDEDVTLIEGEGEGEPVAKRLKAMEDGAASGHALLRGNLIKVKQVPS